MARPTYTINVTNDAAALADIFARVVMHAQGMNYAVQDVKTVGGKLVLTLSRALTPDEAAHLGLT